MIVNRILKNTALTAATIAILCATGLQDRANAAEPVRLVFDTDMGNDIDDALALGVIHALLSRGECQLLAVTLTKDNPLAVRYVDAVNTFYGRGDIPIGRVRLGKTPDDGKFIGPPVEALDDGKARYPHDLQGETDTPNPTDLLRKVLAAQPDQSVVIAQVGFSTNLARLLESSGDDHSPLGGRELVAQKVKLLSMMAGRFDAEAGFKEYNVAIDLESAEKVIANWPTPIVASGFEIGLAIEYPATSIERDYAYVPHHPLAEAYRLYIAMPYDRPTWDLTSVLYAVRPDRDYFGLSAPGTIHVADGGVTTLAPSDGGAHRYLTVTPEQIVRVKEALIQLSSQPPQGLPAMAPAVPEKK